MNKKDALKIADEIGIKTYPSWWTGVPENELLAFANACEKIGMEKAAKICNEYPKRDPAEDGNGYWAAENCAEAIRKEIK